MLAVAIALVVVLTVDVARVWSGPASVPTRVAAPVAVAHQRWWSAAAGNGARGGVVGFRMIPDPGPFTHRRHLLDWSALAWCESRGHWRENTGNGFYGGVQFALPTWRSVGGRGLPSDASRAEQLHRARILFRRDGAWPSWPVCGVYLVGGAR